MRRIKLENLTVTNGGGMCKTLADVERFAKSSVTRITVGSATWLERVGNKAVPPGDVYCYDEETGRSGNSLGLPNMGTEKLLKTLPEMVRIAHAAGKTLVVNIVGESVEQFIKLALMCFACGVDGVELNLACPNVHDKGVQKPMFCNDPTLVEDILWRLVSAGVKGKHVGIKIAPTKDEKLLSELCHVVELTDIVTEVVACNTVGGQTFLKDGVHQIAFLPPGGTEVQHTAGEAGKPIHALCVWVVAFLAEHLPPEVGILGLGGNFTGQDALDHIDAGATGIGAATSVMKFGEGIFQSMLGELVVLMPESESEAA